MPPKKDKKKEEEPLFQNPQYVSSLFHNFNHDCRKLYNVHLVDEFTFISAVGNTVQFVDMTTKKTEWIVGRDGGGIGAICVHPTREGSSKAVKYFAVAEKIGLQTAPTPASLPRKPRVYIYTYPAKKLYKQLKDGTEQLYTACAFSASGEKFATVGGREDYMLTVWNWETESVILRFKAWGSEVFRVSFNPYDDGFLCTSGVGHLKFWEMAKTFTGLKLKGDIGKFGKVDIQDVCGYAELPDGKVLSGSEDGNLLLWEAYLLKVEVTQPVGRNCHAGPCEVVMLLDEPAAEEGEKPKRVFMSAGHDGYMKYWDFGILDMADIRDGFESFDTDCVREVLIDESCCIKAVTKGDNYWLIQDANGGYWKTKMMNYEEIYSDAPSPKAEQIMSFHAGPITCVEASPRDHACLTGGADGTLRLWDYINRREVYLSRFSAGVTSAQWLPTSVDPDGDTLVAAFENGAIRVVKRTQAGFALCSVWKPHTDSITCFGFNSAYNWVVTASKDGTIFFFQIKNILDGWVPIGQSKIPHLATCVYWESDDRCVLGLSNGDIIAIERPDPKSIDPEVTFVFECSWSNFLYNQKVRPKEKKKRALDDPDALDLDDEANEDEDEEEEQELAPEDIGPFPVNALKRLPKDLGGNLVIAMRHSESCFDYAGIAFPVFNPQVESEYPISNTSYHKTTVSTMKLSAKNNYLIQACEGGQILLRDAQGRGASPLKKVWHIPVAHDGRADGARQGGGVHSGFVTGVATSFDEAILLSVSMDGSFFAYKLGKIEAAPAEKDLPKGTPVAPEAEVLPEVPAELGTGALDHAAMPSSLKAPPAKTADDISAADALSIQEQKVKDDEDRARAAAEAKKLSLRDRVRILQSKYEEIVQQNEQAPQGKKVAKEDLQLDPEITELLHIENNKRVEGVVQQYAWHTEKAELSLQKLLDVYLHALKVERIMLHAFRSGKCVSSFRTPELTETQTKRIDKVHALIQAEEQRRAAMHRDPAADRGEPTSPLTQGAGASGGSPVSNPSGSPRDAQMFPADAPPPAAGEAAEAGALEKVESQEIAKDLNQTDSSILQTHKSVRKKDEKPQPKSQLEKAEERKKERADRKARFDALMDRKPQQDQEDPRDVQQVQRAERNMGDRKLKTDPTYTVKEHERVTAERKERQLVLLEESINTLRIDFNERFIAMRDLKERLIANINRDLRHIEKINKQLLNFGVKVDEKIELFTMKDDERPDKLRAETISHEELARYEKEKERERKREEKRKRAAAGGDVLGGSDDEDEEPEKKPDAHDVTNKRTSIAKVHRRESGVITAQMRYNIEMQTRLDNIAKSPLEEEEDTIRRRQLEYEKAKLQRKIDKTISTFDEALDELRREKFKLEGDLKMADMRILLLYRELVLLKIFKNEDEKLTKRQEDTRNDKMDVTVRTNQCQDKLNDKKVEIKRLLERESEIMSDMLRVMSSAPPECRDPLMKIFRKKVKRKKRRAEGEEGEEEEEEEEESSSEGDWGDDEGEQQQEDEEDACPDGCDEDTYDAVLELRTRRLDQEDIVNDFQKSIDHLKKENEQLTVRERKTNTALAKVDKEIEAFQKKKQQDLNKLDTVVVLKLNQVRCLNALGQVPFQKETQVIFTNGGMNELRNRILQLQNDKKALRRDFDQQKKIRRGLDRAKKEAEVIKQQWKQKTKDVQLLKFGQEVDLESLEDVSVDRQTEELKARLRAEEAKWERAMKVQQQALKRLKEQQQQATANNSQALQHLASLREEKQRLEGQLNVSQNKILTRMAGGSRVATASDRANLKDLVVMQQREIDALKNEIAMLRRKGGHVYTPVVSRVVTQQADGAGGPDQKPAAPPDGQQG